MASPLRVPARLPLGPGPSPVAPAVLRALASPVLGHLDPAFLAIMDEVQARLRAVFGTRNERTFALPGTGSSGMEAVVVNLIEPGDRVVVGACGVFGDRLRDQAERVGARVDVVSAPPGEGVPVAALREALAREGASALLLVHAETSTGVLQDLDGLGEACRAAGALFVLDVVTSLGGVPLSLDALGVDAAYSCSQKCLGAPPGLSPVSFSERAWERRARRRTRVPSRYLDLALLVDYWGPARAYHHTAPVSLFYALHEALGLLLDEGLAAAALRHRRAQDFLLGGLAALGLEPFAPAAARAPTVSSIRTPAGVDEAAVRRLLLERRGVEIGGGLGPLKGAIWRVGHMGHGAREEFMTAVVDGLRDVLADARAAQPPR